MARYSISLVSTSSLPGAMTSLTLSQVRLSVTGSCARYFQKLLTSATCRVRLMSSNTARTSGAASRYSIGTGMSPSSVSLQRYRGSPRRTTGTPVDQKNTGDADRHAEQTQQRQLLVEQ